MSAPKQPELITKELPDELQFRYEHGDRRVGWIVSLVLVPFIFMFMPLATRAPGFFAIMMSIFLAGGLYIGITAARNWNRVYITTLSVTAQRFEATGDNLKMDWMCHATRRGTIVVPVSDVRGVGYSSGGRGEPCGLYVNCGILRSPCLLPWLSREQATAVAVAIARRFPNLGSKMTPGR
jgi:hypothetical protein